MSIFTTVFDVVFAVNGTNVISAGSAYKSGTTDKITFELIMATFEIEPIDVNALLLNARDMTVFTFVCPATLPGKCQSVTLKTVFAGSTSEITSE